MECVCGGLTENIVGSWFAPHRCMINPENCQWYGVSTDIDGPKAGRGQLKATSAQLRALSASVQSAREQKAPASHARFNDELGGH